MHFTSIFGLILLLGACGTSVPPHAPIPIQQWEGIVIQVQSHPTPVRAGMNEFVIIINDQLKGIRPAYDYIVSLRTADQFPWRQAIQDGHNGVYRRAVPLKQVKDAILYMHLKKEGGETTLQFPLDPALLDQPSAT